MKDIKIGTLLRWHGDDDTGPDDLGIVVHVPLPTCADCSHDYRADCHDLEDCGRAHKFDFSDEVCVVDWINESSPMRHDPNDIDDWLYARQVEIVG